MEDFSHTNWKVDYTHPYAAVFVLWGGTQFHVDVLTWSSSAVNWQELSGAQTGVAAPKQDD